MGLLRGILGVFTIAHMPTQPSNEALCAQAGLAVAGSPAALGEPKVTWNPKTESV